MGYYLSSAWKCPFFIANPDNRTITCQSGNQFKFPAVAYARDWANRYCCSFTGWHYCQLAVMWELFYTKTGAEPPEEKNDD